MAARPGTRPRAALPPPLLGVYTERESLVKSIGCRSDRPGKGAMFAERPMNSTPNAPRRPSRRDPGTCFRRYLGRAVGMDRARPYLGSLARSKFSLPWESPPFKISGGRAPRQPDEPSSRSRTIQSGNGGSGTVLPARECVLSPRNWIMPPRMNVWQVNFPAPVS